MSASVSSPKTPAPPCRRAGAATTPSPCRSATAPTRPVLAVRIEAATGLAVVFTGPRPAAEREGEGGTPAFASLPGPDRLSPAGGIWTGPLDALLDAWCAGTGYAWRHDAERGAIEIVRSRATVFRIHALAGQQTYTTTASSQGSEGGDGRADAAGQTIATQSAHDPWPELEAQLKALVADDTTIAVAPSSASVLARGRPAQIARVRAFLAHLNREVLRPVTLSVHVYTVTWSRESSLDLSLTATVSRILGSAFDLRVAAEGALSLIRPAAGGPSTLNATIQALQGRHRLAGAVGRHSLVERQAGAVLRVAQAGLSERAEHHRGRRRGADRADARHGVLGLRLPSRRQPAPPARPCTRNRPGTPGGVAVPPAADYRDKGRERPRDQPIRWRIARCRRRQMCLMTATAKPASATTAARPMVTIHFTMSFFAVSVFALVS